jgi:proteasome lid subunit RPN8/RPN11
MSRARAVTLPPAVRRAILAQARREQPLECCGFLLGDRGRVRYAVPARNVAQSPVRFRIDDTVHLTLRRTLRTAAPPLAIVGIYHSHPASAPLPSPTDLAEAWYPDWLYLIVGRSGRRWRLRAFTIREGDAREVRLVPGV